jgi:micrococcal nuclease
LAEIQSVVSRFFEEAYNAGGDLDVAYALFASDTRATCPLSRFQRLAEVARSLVAPRRLQVDQIRAVRITGDAATLTVELSQGNFTASFFPTNVTLRREQGQWRYVVTTDPTCQSLFAFFDLDPGIEVTSAAQADPRCDPSYPEFCIAHSPPDLDCADITQAKPFAAVPPDPHGFDTDNDGFGCEANQPSDR